MASLYAQRNDKNKDGVKVLVRTDSFSVLIDSLQPNDIKIRGAHVDNYWELPDTVARIRRYANQYKDDFKNKVSNMPPIVIECLDHGNIVRNGDHRLIAVKIAREELREEGLEMTHVAVKEFKEGNNASRRLMAWKTADSQPLSTVDQAELIKAMKVEDGLSVEEIASGAGISVQRVYQLLKTADLSDEDKRDIEKGLKSAKAATEADAIARNNVKKESTKVLLSCLNSAKPDGKGQVTITVPVEVYEALKAKDKKTSKKSKGSKDV